MMKLALLIILPLVLAAAVPGDGVEGCTGHSSPHALGEQLPQLVQSVPNGKKYTLGTPSIMQTTTAGNSTWSR